MKPINVVRICSKEFEIGSINVISKLKEKYNINIETHNSIPNLFQLLSDPKFNPDIISIYIEDMYYSSNSPFEILQTLDILRNTIVSADFKKRNIKFIIAIKPTEDPALIKEILISPAIYCITLRKEFIDREQEWLDYANHTIRTINDGVPMVPKEVMDILRKSKKKQNTSNKIILTPRQDQIYKLVSERGYSNKVIGKLLNLSESTVKLHISAILKKYGARNRTQLVAFSKTTK